MSATCMKFSCACVSVKLMCISVMFHPLSVVICIIISILHLQKKLQQYFVHNFNFKKCTVVIFRELLRFLFLWGHNGKSDDIFCRQFGVRCHLTHLILKHLFAAKLIRTIFVCDDSCSNIYVAHSSLCCLMAMLFFLTFPRLTILIFLYLRLIYVSFTYDLHKSIAV